MRIPIINGIYTDNESDFRTAYPRNMVPIAQKQGLSQGYLRPADGIVALGSGSTSPGVDRGAINWNGIHYRIIGNRLLRVESDGTVIDKGYIAGTGQVSLDYSFDYLAIAGGGNLYLYDGGTLTKITDADLGTSIDVIWIDGYFMTTDGEYLVVTELSDPFSVNPTKYGSSEVDPDPVLALKKIKDEAYALNRHTIEVFRNTGGTNFPFQRIDGAQIDRGTIGTHSNCVFLDSIVFLGGGKNESPAIWLGAGGTTTKLSTREIDLILAEYTETQLASVVMETHIDQDCRQFFIHLPDQTIVYDATASAAVSNPVWFILTTNGGQYLARNMVWVHNKWIVGNPAGQDIGVLSREVSSHWGSANSWEFSTTIIYNDSNGAIFHELELVALSGRGGDDVIWTQYSLDGKEWSQPISITAGDTGDRTKRLVWLRQGTMRNWRIQKFKGTSKSHLSIAVLDARIEGLSV